MNNNLSLDEKIGQRFIFGINNHNIDEIIELIKNAYIGGVVLYKRNYQNYEEMIEVIKKIKLANKDNKLPLFIAIDQEGGRVNRLPDDIHNLKNIYDISKDNINLVIDYANIIGRILNETGINMNLGPVLDIYNNSKALYKRCFYGDLDNVSKCGINYLNGINNNVIPVIKHYPGHGCTRKDSHFIIPYIFNYQKILDKHMIPFDKLINAGIDAIMVGHLVIRKLTNFLPASISNKFINTYLRDHYDGLIITDEINMLKRWPIYNLIYQDKAIKTNSDILLVKIKEVNEGYKIINKYKKILSRNSKYITSLDDSVKKIIMIKEKYKLNDDIDNKGIDIDKINIEIDKINSKIR